MTLNEFFAGWPRASGTSSSQARRRRNVDVNEINMAIGAGGVLRQSIRLSIATG